jgi:hypothetical protein
VAFNIGNARVILSTVLRDLLASDVDIGVARTAATLGRAVIHATEKVGWKSASTSWSSALAMRGATEMERRLNALSGVFLGGDAETVTRCVEDLFHAICGIPLYARLHERQEAAERAYIERFGRQSSDAPRALSLALSHGYSRGDVADAEQMVAMLGVDGVRATLTLTLDHRKAFITEQPIPSLDPGAKATLKRTSIRVRACVPRRYGVWRRLRIWPLRTVK